MNIQPRQSLSYREAGVFDQTDDFAFLDSRIPHFETPLLYFKIAELSLSDWSQMVLYGLTPHTEENIRIVLEGLRGEDSIPE